ncbi:MAG: methyltransferase domain-containing protein [Patescibacteria group bacterium]
MKTVVILPTYNERGNISFLIEEILRNAPDVGILVVDDNSPDGTADAVRASMQKHASVRLMSRPGKNGLGAAYIAAFREVLADASVETVITMDADFSHHPKYIPELISTAKRFDLVIGSRYVQGGGIAKWELWRRQLSYWANVYVRMILQYPIRDWTTGYQCITTRALRSIDLDTIDLSGYAFLQELKYALVSSGGTFHEIPIIFQARREGESKISGFIIREGITGPWKIRAQKVTCPVCDKRDGKLMGRRNGYSVYRSRQCQSVFISPLPRDTSRIYGEDYFYGAQGGFGYANYERDKRSQESAFIEYIHTIQKYVSHDVTLLDVGAANGYFVSLASRHGLRARGVEISESASAEGRSKGLDIRQGTIETMDDSSENYDVVTMWDVLEHVPSAHDALAAAHRLLKPGGVIAINTPDGGSLWARIWGAYWHLIVPPEHLVLFSRAGLRIMLERAGFTIISMGTIGKSFSIPYIFSILASWSGIALVRRFARAIEGSRLASLSIPINLHDNMFVIAKKS